MKKIKNIKMILSLLTVLFLTSCAPYRNDQILFEYKDLGVLYYLKSENVEYKYNEYIYDDISNGEYKKTTPSIADYKNGSGAFDYDIEAYINARMDFSIKQELVKKYGIEIDNLCDMVRNEKFLYNTSYVYYYDKNSKENTLLCDLPVTNITYDDEFPKITFDVEKKDTKEVFESFKDRKIKLSDIIAANSTPDAFMKVLLSQGKEKHLYIMNRRVDDDKMYQKVEIATKSSIK